MLLLGACDSGQERQPRAALVGTWVSQGHVQRTLVTVDRAQAIVDVNRPGTGDLRVTGDAAAVLLYAGVYRSSDGREGVTVFSIDSRRYPFPPSYSFLTLSADRTDVTVWTGETYTQYGASHGGGPAAYTLQDGRLSLGGATLPSAGGATVTVTGSLVLPLLRLRAGAEAEVERQEHAPEPGDGTDRYEFRDDGTFRVEQRRPGSLPRSVSGTWTILDGQRLRLTTTPAGEPTDADYDYRIEGGVLSLGVTRDVCAEPNMECLRYHEGRFAIQPGSLVRARIGHEAMFASE